MTAPTMQAFVKHGSTPGDAGLTTVNVPEPGNGEALIRVGKSGEDVPNRSICAAGRGPCR